MAFGFRRESSAARGYVNETNEAFAPGFRLSRRQYDKFVERLGARREVFKPAYDALRATERRLELLERSLTAREASVSAREVEVARRERDLTREAYSGHNLRQAGQRRYNTALDLYVRKRREAGERINKIEARKSAEFKAIMSDLKGEKIRKGSRTVGELAKRRRNADRRARAFRELGDDHGEAFREDYERLNITLVR